MSVDKKDFIAGCVIMCLVFCILWFCFAAFPG